jgi:methyltransferase (TIGR00027 family)
MRGRGSSRTALAVAWLRAAHQCLDAAPRILEDPLALRLLGADSERLIREQAPRYQGDGMRALRAHVVLRSRHAEERLREAVARGVRQYLLLGAGYDTFALRQPPWARALRIVEVDHPASQEAKRACLAAAGLAAPANLVHAAIDFEHEGLLAGLRRRGVDPGLPSFFSWLGVTMYLPGAAVAATLRDIAGCARGSELVLTFAARESPGSEAQALLSGMAQRAAEGGEPWLSYFQPEEMEALLRDCGFGRIDFLTPEQARARYFDTRPADLPPPRRGTIVGAMLD